MQKRKQVGSREHIPLAEERAELAGFLRNQRWLERNGQYPEDHISRGVERAHLSPGPGYNDIHGIDFYRDLDERIKTQDSVSLLDVGCGLGYFMADMIGHAKRNGGEGRFQAHGVTLTRKYLVEDAYDGGMKEMEPAVSPDLIRSAHAENLPFEDGSQDMVVLTKGAYTYYEWGGAKIDRKRQLLDELYRVTAPGGRVYLASDDFKKEDGPLKDFLAANPGAAIERRGKDASQIQIVKAHLSGENK